MVACSGLYPERLPDVVDSLYDAFWVHKRGVQTLEVYKGILEGVIGRDDAGNVLREVRTRTD